MDAERALISKMVVTQTVEKVMAMGFDINHFEKKEHKEIYDFCVAHTRKYSTPPSFERVRDKFPKYNFEVSSEALEAIADDFIAQLKRRMAIEEGRLLMKAIDDPDQVGRIEELWGESARRLATLMPSSRVAKFSEMSNRIELWKQMQKEGKMPGIPMGIPAFDNRTMGIQPHELVSIAGWQGTGKTTLGLYINWNAYLNDKTSLIISLEMEADALFRKFDVMATNISYDAVKSLNLTNEQMAKWEKMAERAAKAKNDIIVIDDLRSCTVDTVHSAIVKYDPDICLVDYVSLMDAPKHASGSMWEKITHITGGLKQSARALKKPIIAIAQTNKESYESGADLSNISYSRSIGQDSDLVFGLHQTPDMRENNRMQVRMLKNRDGARCTVDMLWKMNTMEFREWGPSDSFGSPGA